MTYTEIKRWAENKIANNDFQRKFDIEDIEVNKIFPIHTFNIPNDAVRELVLESCDTTARTPMSEINILNNEDMLALKRDYDELKSKMDEAFEWLRTAYITTMGFCDKIEEEIAEIKSGRKSIHDMEEDIKYLYPQTYNFKRCATCLDKNSADLDKE